MDSSCELGRKRPHQAVNHAAGEYVRGEIHTANIDSFWSLIKRGIFGSFHHVSKAYLPLYLMSSPSGTTVGRTPTVLYRRGGIVTGAGSPKKPAARRKRKKRAGPVSLHPLSFDDAMRALLQVKPLKARGNPEHTKAEANGARRSGSPEEE
jgi:ISXO2-like transposase domain